MARHKLLTVLLLFSTTVWSQELKTVFEKSNYKETSTYLEGIEYYKRLAATAQQVSIKEFGLTDAGYPLHLVMIAKNGDFSVESNRKKGRSIILINNAIHPGEPDGVEASQMLARDLINNRKMSKLLDNTLVAIIPFYNIGGALNRNTGSRTNQNGPHEKGFRGNARNFDLNRDFIKNDTKNSQSFTEIFHLLDPDVMVDTHVSNGADYQYVITMVTPQSDKLGEPLKAFLDDAMMPALYQQMQKTEYEMTPYVNVWGSTPDKGWSQFFDAPRYSSGYAALFQTIGFQSETHMLKSFEQRTWATYNFLKEMLVFLDENGHKLMQVRQQARNEIIKKEQFAIDWALDKSDSTMIEFKGYKATYPESEVTGLQRLKYDRDQPYTMMVPYFDSYKASKTVEKPAYYLIPQAWSKVIAALKRNRINLVVAEQDSVIRAEVYYIADYSSVNTPWEGHYFHRKVETTKVTEQVDIHKGDVLVPTNQQNNRYIVETLEPEATDSFFRWNYFDSMLQMKEGFSAYVFEDEALEILNNNPELKSKFEEKKNNDEEFRNNEQKKIKKKPTETPG